MLYDHSLSYYGIATLLIGLRVRGYSQHTVFCLPELCTIAVCLALALPGGTASGFGLGWRRSRPFPNAS